MESTTLTGYEALSQPFRYILEHYPDKQPDLAALTGKPYTVRLPMPDGTMRPLNGIVFQAEQGPSTVRSTRYRLELRPWFLLLEQERTCAVFQNMSVPEIVSKVCHDAGFGNVRNMLNAQYPPKEYTVRYAETSFAFLCRLMAEAGIFYFFEHDDSSHTLVMADSLSACPNCAQGATLQWLAARTEEGKRPDTPSAHIFDISLSRQAVPASCCVDDYNPLTPSTSLSANVGGGAFPCLGFSMAGHSTQQSGEALAGIRLDACEAGSVLLHATSPCAGLAAGSAFAVSGHPDMQANSTYVASQLHFTATFTNNENANSGQYCAELTALPASARYRPLPALAPPRLSGPLTGVVTGKDNEQIWTDQHGRCKIRFHWQGASDDTSSCWVRVAQPWTGNGFGAQFLPRVGQEVVISFVGGDPDRPMVTGMLYNSGNPPPWSLPENATCSGLLTRSLPDGQAGNELRFDDKKDAELIYLHAQKNLTYHVEDARTVTIIGEGGDALTLEKSSRITTLKQGNDTLKLHKGNRSVELQNGNEHVNVKGNRTVETSGNEERKHGGMLVINVKGDYTLKVSGNLTIEAGGSLKLTSGDKASIEAKRGLDIDSGAGLALTAKGTLASKGNIVNVKSSTTGEIDGGALLTLKGGLIKIN